MAAPAKIPLLGLSKDGLRLLRIVLCCAEGVLYSESFERCERVGGVDFVTLVDLCSWYNVGNDGLDGNCFENAVHVALRDGEEYITPFVREVAEEFCGLKGNIVSIQFSPEKDAMRPSVGLAEATIDDDARLFLLNRQIGPKLKQHMSALAKSVRNDADALRALPAEIAAAGKADIFLGSNDIGLFAATTIKINPGAVKGGPGLTIAIHPHVPGTNGDPRIDKKLGLVRIPLPYENGFTELFGIAMGIMRAFLAERDARIPGWQKLPDSEHRAVCQELERHRDLPVKQMVAQLRAAAARAEQTLLPISP